MFNLTEEQQLMVNIARDFAVNEVRPKMKEIENYESDYKQLSARLCELGLRGVLIPEEWGGLGQNLATQASITREIARESMVLAFLIGNGSAYAMMSAGTDEQKEKYLRKLASGEFGMGFGFTEPQAGSDAAGIQTTAVKVGDEWVLNGTKSFITGCNYRESFLVTAKTNETAPGGITTFIVPRDIPGFSSGAVTHNLGARGSDTGEIHLKNCRIPAKNMVGIENKGLRVAFCALDIARVTLAANALGNAESAFEKAVAFAKERIIGGQPLYKMQVIQHYFAEMKTDIEVTRAMLEHTCALGDAGLPYGTEGAMVKLYASEMGCRVTDKAVQICGGYGLVQDFGVEQHYRNARMVPIIEGTSEVQKMIIARSIFGK
jgi:butyryl-CoA dehydrogenase